MRRPHLAIHLLAVNHIMPSPILRSGEAATNNKQKLTEVGIEFTIYECCVLHTDHASVGDVSV